MDQIKATQRKMSQQDMTSAPPPPPEHYEANTLEQFSNASSPLPLELSTSPLLPHGTVESGPSPRGANNLSATPGAPTPSSANMTLSLDGYLEPTRVSLSTPYIPLPQPITSPSDESFPVFSPPPYSTIRERQRVSRRTSSARRGSDIGPPWLRAQMQDQLERHRPSYSTISPALSHHASLSSSGRLSSYGVSYSIFEKKPGRYRSSSAHGVIDKSPVVFRVLNRRTFKRRWTFPCTAVQ
ncbi:hypothetical protein Anas_05508, partial [Armadillidium nasatum]